MSYNNKQFLWVPGSNAVHLKGKTIIVNIAKSIEIWTFFDIVTTMHLLLKGTMNSEKSIHFYTEYLALK